MNKNEMMKLVMNRDFDEILVAPTKHVIRKFKMEADDQNVRYTKKKFPQSRHNKREMFL